MKIQALLLSLIITTGAAMAQGNFTTCEVKPTDKEVVSVCKALKENADQHSLCIVELENRVIALEKKVSSLIKIVKMLQTRVGTK